MKPTKKNILYMLEESNGIEEIYDKQSLKDAYSAWIYLMENDTLTNDILKDAHKILMQNQPLHPSQIGIFRNSPVNIGGVKKSLPRIVIESLIMDLLVDVNNPVQISDVIMHHIQFESIHPFMDGNGRMGRLIMNWEMLKRFEQQLIVFKASEKEDIYYPMFR